MVQRKMPSRRHLNKIASLVVTTPDNKTGSNRFNNGPHMSETASTPAIEAAQTGSNRLRGDLPDPKTGSEEESAEDGELTEDEEMSEIR